MDTNQLMAALASATNTDLDSAGDDMLHARDGMRITVFANLLSEAEYDDMEMAIASAEVTGEGFIVYVWNDGSGYEYWHEQGEAEESNYIQVTAHISNVRRVDIDELNAAIETVYSALCHWDNVDEYFSQRKA